MWVIFSALWVAICATIVIIDGRLLEANKTYEIEGRFKERYEVVAPARATESEVVAFVEQNKRSDCTENKTGPWCSYPMKLQMPRNSFDWFFVYLGTGVPAASLLLGAGLYWAFSGFRRAA
ncbi:hypothetical protein CQ12_13825 [Bradyrhizobium jicamae]|uniref:Uncharacterized protein n=1 Tax=Bradyrhizobium jicamae TaxID=280332 RepID=A0A0R3LP25_9BRAD|nr:hypothetical protein CQ12_13825 [Bradyrhizobium jicamae]